MINTGIYTNYINSHGSVMFYNASILLKPPFPFPPRGKGFALLPLYFINAPL